MTLTLATEGQTYFGQFQDFGSWKMLTEIYFWKDGSCCLSNVFQCFRYICPIAYSIFIQCLKQRLPPGRVRERGEWCARWLRWVLEGGCFLQQWAGWSRLMDPGWQEKDQASWQVAVEQLKPGGQRCRRKSTGLISIILSHLVFVIGHKSECLHLVFISIIIFIGPRCPWGPIYGSWSL